MDSVGSSILHVSRIRVMLISYYLLAIFPPLASATPSPFLFFPFVTGVLHGLAFLLGWLSLGWRNAECHSFFGMPFCYLYSISLHAIVCSVLICRTGALNSRMRKSPAMQQSNTQISCWQQLLGEFKEKTFLVKLQLLLREQKLLLIFLVPLHHA